jgi:RNA polymerase-binding transcription factor
MTNTRRIELGQLLEDRRHQIQQDVQNRMRDGRSGRSGGVSDLGETSEAGSQADLDFAVLQKQVEALDRVDEALARIDEGAYGSCVECHGDIPEQRLKALPFAARCKSCEEKHERSAHRPVARRNGPLFSDAATE